MGESAVEVADFGFIRVDLVIVFGDAGFEHEAHFFADDFFVIIAYV